MSSPVSRKKYDNIKRKAIQWREKAMNAEEVICNLKDDIQQLKLTENGENSNQLQQEYEQTLRENKELEEKLRDASFRQERELFRRDSEIDRLRMTLEDYKDRYKEIREDNKELRKSTRTVRA